MAVAPRFVEYPGQTMHRFTEPTPVPSSVAIIVVFVEGWEIECCGTPPVVGQDTTWTLTFVEADAESGGYFSGTRHSGIVPEGIGPTTGRVLGLQVESRQYRMVDNMWQPVAGTRILRRIPCSPKWFACDLDTTGRVETGVLMEVACLTEDRQWATNRHRSNATTLNWEPIARTNGQRSTGPL